jgi:hypothetical protein
MEVDMRSVGNGFLGVLVALLLTSPPSLLAQGSARPKFDLVTLAGSFGGFSELANLNDAGTADWRIGWSAQADISVWLHQYVGLRASGSWAQDSIRGTVAAPGTRRKFNKFFYDAGLVLRYPVKLQSGTIIPYVLGGAGAVTLHRLESPSDEDFTKFAGNFGLGVEYRYQRIGVRLEGRDLVYRFDRYGFDKTQHGLAWNGGVTLSF